MGLGKTHLIQAVGNTVKKENLHKKIKYVTTERFTSEVVTTLRSGNLRPNNMDEFKRRWREFDLLIIDDIQFLSGKEKTQEELFHTFNVLSEAGKQVVFSSDRHPKSIQNLEERLRSRFEGGMIADISNPDFESRLAILKTKIAEYNIEVADDVCEYIVSHIQRNIRELEGALNRLLAFHRLNNKTPTLQEARTLLRSVIQNPSRVVSPKKIMQTVAEFYDLKEREIIAISRKKEVVRPRQIAMYLLREELKSSYPLIGKRFGGKDHTTAIYACEKISKEIQESESFFDEINLIKQRIYNG